MKMHVGSVALLFESSIRSIPFNIILALFLTISLLYNKVPPVLVAKWFAAIVLITAIRWGYSKLAIKHGFEDSNQNVKLLIFMCLTFAMGAVWGSCYFIFASYFTYVHEGIIILVLGGMSAGSIASLSVYTPAYYAYILPMFLPIIVYNFSIFELDRIILATMYTLFIVMLMITAKINSRLLHKIFQLSDEKDELIEELMISNQKLEQSNEEIKLMSITDPLTGLYNRRYFESAMKVELNRAKRNNYSINLAFIDVDNFKHINDTFGHLSGDEALVYIAKSLKQSIRRSNDLVFRLGGDEFAVIFVNMSLPDAISVCTHIQNQLKDKVGFNHPTYNLTISLGIVSIPYNSSSTFESIITAADKALYEAKQNGKNQVVSKKLTK
jgi:diguanylate cyclase (GGDEF)-like protein